MGRSLVLGLGETDPPPERGHQAGVVADVGQFAGAGDGAVAQLRGEMFLGAAAGQAGPLGRLVLQGAAEDEGGGGVGLDGVPVLGPDAGAGLGRGR
uniref:hypothetical protein n=1 Tax=Streptomyces albidoflavus TaxID=1886 RepID=UPI0019D260D2